MINIDFSTAIGLYLLMVILLIGISWVIFEQRIKTKGFLRLWPKKNIWHCSICAYTYIDKETEISICPRCKSYNKREKIERGDKL
ncbi:MAG: hypothetical protein NC818_02080 [Candidatus Omnitrophica bacterium]|nr:hypothetical protein [Candidatus Omnitrophota bacterium]